MSLQDGLAALHLEMPRRVPRTEYSAESHWKLVETVTGIKVTPQSSVEEQWAASCAFRKAWNYDLHWNVAILMEIFGETRTRMGHANFAAGNVDYDSGTSALFTEPEDVLDFSPSAVFGPIDRIAVREKIEKHYASSCTSMPDGVNMTGIYVTLMSGLIELFGWEMLLMAHGIDAAGFGKVTHDYARWIYQYFELLAESSAPVVMVHDDIVWTEGPFLKPDWYREYIFPNYKKLFAPLLESGKKVLFTSDGNYTAFVDDIAACGVHGFVMEPTTDMQYVAEHYGKTHVFVGNADTRILLNGTRDQIYAEVKRCMDIGKKYPGFFMAVGNHIPANTPVENALFYNEVYQELAGRG